MRWLEWSTIDLKSGLGGVEVHARSLARELDKKGIEVGFSTNIKDLEDPSWDVIHTHGSAPALKRNTSSIRAHTLHGTTLGRMAACHEWTWPGGYAAAFREVRGALSSDVLFTVQPSLWLYSLLLKLGKPHAVCWNGWDPSDLPGTAQALPDELQHKLEEMGSFWIYVGRGGDRMKAVERLRGAMMLLPDLRWAVAPGQGFEAAENTLQTGTLSSAQVRQLMAMSSGLVLCSKYEGNSLVILEALAQGTPVVATKVGAVPVLPQGLQGLITSDSGSAQSLADAIRAADGLDPSARSSRAAANRKILPTWEKVTDIYLEAIQHVLKTRRSGHG